LSETPRDRLKDKLDHLFRLQDLDIMIREAQDPEMKSTEEKMGVRISALEKLLAARSRLAEKVPPADLRLYERIARRHSHAIVPVEDRTCLGCHMALPTAAVSLRSDPEHIRTCENCGRILYWLE
jgi:predicted  nucleic acid-binding Zn-ribbon protein